MSMLKKTAALTVSAVLLLQPMTASAVTWGNIVNGLRNSGSNRYTEDGTTIEKDGENYTDFRRYDYRRRKLYQD